MARPALAEKDPNSMDVVEPSPVPTAVKRSPRRRQPSKRARENDSDVETDAIDSAASRPLGKPAKPASSTKFSAVDLIKTLTERFEAQSVLAEKRALKAENKLETVLQEMKAMSNKVTELEMLVTSLTKQTTGITLSGINSELTDGQNNLSQTYANAVRMGGSQSPTNLQTRGMSPSLQSMPSIIIDMSKVADSTLNADNPGKVRKRVDEAFSAFEETKQIKCRGVSKDPKNLSKLKIILSSEEEVKIVRINNRWLNTYLRGASILRDQWYPVRIDNVYKQAVLADEQSSTLQENVLAQLGAENGCEILRCRWLSRPDSRKSYGSMVIFLSKREDAERLIHGGLFDINGESAFPKFYEKRTSPPRCFNCQQYGHYTYRCSSEIPVCGSCATQGHTHRDCTSLDVRCAPCGGPHRANDPGCPKYIEARNTNNSPAYV